MATVQTEQVERLMRKQREVAHELAALVVDLEAAHPAYADLDAASSRADTSARRLAKAVYGLKIEEEQAEKARVEARIAALQADMQRLT